MISHSHFLDVLYNILCAANPLVFWEKKERHSRAFFDLSDGRIEKFIDTYKRNQSDIYFGVCLRIPDFSGRGKSKETAVMPGFWLDVDIQTPGCHAATNLPPDVDTAMSLLDLGDPPSIVVHTGGGLHCYWLFEQPVMLDNTNRAFYEAHSKEFQNRYIDHAASRGYHLDQTGDLARVLRVPGTLNYKDLDNPREVTVVYPEEISDPVVRYPAPSMAKPASIPALVLKPTSQALRGLSFSRKKTQEAYDLVMLGKPFAPLGTRDKVLNELCGAVAFRFPDAAPADLVDLFRPSLESFAADDGTSFSQEQREQWCHEKAEKALAKAQNQRDSDRKDRETQINALRHGSTTTRPDDTMNPHPPSGENNQYTPDDIKIFSGQQGCSPEDFRIRWVIQKSDNYYVYQNGRYSHALSKSEFTHFFERMLAPAYPEYIDFWTLTSRGQPRKKTMSEMAAEYGTCAVSVECSLTHQDSVFDGRTFIESVCPLKPMEPVYHEKIATWINLLGGENAAKLLDWIASVTRLDACTCALYIYGTPGSGKSLLVNGLSRLWAKAPTKLESLENFNADVASCPLIYVDEGIATATHGKKSATAELRDLIGSTTRPLKRKFLPNAPMNGAIRLIMTANNDNLLRFDEALSADDVNAVAQRFLRIHANQAATSFLEKLGREEADSWFNADKIAQHATWLAQNRTVIPGRRFLVEGTGGDIKHQLALQGEWESRVIEFCCMWLRNPLPIDNAPPWRKGLIAGEGEVLVNSSTMVAAWDTYMPEKPTPALNKIGQALRNLAIDKASVRHNGITFWTIPVEAILYYAEQNQINPIADIERTIARKNS